jgi:all-trans-retinol 13,14-reductase
VREPCPAAPSAKNDGYRVELSFCDQRRRNDLLNGDVAVAYVSFPSLKDPAAQSHSAEIISFLDYKQVEQWSRQPWRKRDDEYQALKRRISGALLSFVERRHAGFSALVNYSELATPLTFEHFAAHPQGAIYGLPSVPERYSFKWLGISTPVPGLLMTGSDVCGHGIVGAMMGGVGTAAHVLGGAGFFRIMAAASRKAKSS